MTDLTSLRFVIARALVALAFVHVLMLAGITYALGQDTVTIGMAALACAAVRPCS